MQPNEESVVAVSSADNRLSLWDFAVEADEKEADEEIPEQLMFLHQGQDNIKEIRYHPYYYEMVVSTALNGFHVFKPNLDDYNAREEEEEEDPSKIQKIKEKDLDRYLHNMKISDN